MNKRIYKSPVFNENSTLTPDDDPTIVIGPSQGTSGDESIFKFSGISQDDLDMIELNCDDIDLAAMDANEDYIITDEEFQAWLAGRGGW